MGEQQEQSKPAIPAWRAELSERVREIRARKDGSLAAAAAPITRRETEPTAPLPPSNQPPGIALERDKDPDKDRERIGVLTRTKFASRIHAAEREISKISKVDATVGKRGGDSPLVQAALTRVQRASENARRSSLPRIEPSRPSPGPNALAVDRQATARVLEPPVLEPEVPPAVQPIAETRTLMRERRNTPPLSSPPAVSIAVAPEPRIIEEFEAPKVHREAECIKQLDEDHCLDYLEAEVERVDRELHQNWRVTDGVPLATHALLNVIDLCVISASCAPFLAIIRVINGSLDEAGTLQAAGIICLLVTTFYLGLTQLLGNRTFGMMFTGTKLVAASHLGKATPGMLLMRTAGYFLSFGLGLAGFLWLALDSQRRSWHDRISGTVIVRDL